MTTDPAPFTASVDWRCDGYEPAEHHADTLLAGLGERHWAAHRDQISTRDESGTLSVETLSGRSVLGNVDRIELQWQPPVLKAWVTETDHNGLDRTTLALALQAQQQRMTKVGFEGLRSDQASGSCRFSWIPIRRPSCSRTASELALTVRSP